MPKLLQFLLEEFEHRINMMPRSLNIPPPNRISSKIGETICHKSPFMLQDNYNLQLFFLFNLIQFLHSMYLHLSRK